MRGVPFAAYVTAPYDGKSGYTSKVVQVNGRPGVYHSVDAALRDEHTVITLCQKHNCSIELVTALSVQTVLRFNKYGRISGRKKADTITGTKSGA